jgi:hypothetical protein
MNTVIWPYTKNEEVVDAEKGIQIEVWKNNDMWNDQQKFLRTS